MIPNTKLLEIVFKSIGGGGHLNLEQNGPALKRTMAGWTLAGWTLPSPFCPFHVNGPTETDEVHFVPPPQNENGVAYLLN